MTHFTYGTGNASMSGKEVIFLHDFYSNLIWSCHFHRRIQTSFSCLSILGRQLRNLCVPQRKNLCRAESQQLSEIVLWKSLATQPSCYLMQSAVNIFQHRPDSLKLHQVPRGSEDFTLDSMIHQKITIHKTPFLAVASRFFFCFHSSLCSPVVQRSLRVLCSRELGMVLNGVGR